eukprot:Hpha_TRINITY_DN7488_c0_g1::TRINITY_DN7488_c0_g1_i1::g.95915::m.95915
MLKDQATNSLFDDQATNIVPLSKISIMMDEGCGMDNNENVQQQQYQHQGAGEGVFPMVRECRLRFGNRWGSGWRSRSGIHTAVGKPACLSFEIGVRGAAKTSLFISVRLTTVGGISRVPLPRRRASTWRQTHNSQHLKSFLPRSQAAALLRTRGEKVDMVISLDPRFRLRDHAEVVLKGIGLNGATHVGIALLSFSFLLLALLVVVVIVLLLPVIQVIRCFGGGEAHSRHRTIQLGGPPPGCKYDGGQPFTYLSTRDPPRSVGAVASRDGGQGDQGADQ